MTTKVHLSFMEQLSQELREKVKKSPSEKIKAKLVEAGMQQVEIDKFTREQLMEKYAEVLFKLSEMVEEEATGEVSEAVEGAKAIFFILFYYSNRTVVHQEGLSSNLLFNVKLFTQQFTSIRFQC